MHSHRPTAPVTGEALPQGERDDGLRLPLGSHSGGDRTMIRSMKSSTTVAMP
jgi:hypothetical protein